MKNLIKQDASHNNNNNNNNNNTLLKPSLEDKYNGFTMISYI